MKFEHKLYLGLGVFFAVIVAIYWFWSGESGGSTLILASALLGLVPGAYLGWWAMRMKPRPEDLEDPTSEESTGVVGAFPTYTIWPFVMGMGAFMIGLAMVFGSWTLVIGFAFAISAAISVTLESKRGGAV
ncbi:MAG: cytochrome c oxidase subunit 4 [Acidimicrobiaceae bacterium]|nr:cytochrome c oxidase subunit 4 [Acidimicrobiaceae bacterium]